MHLAIAPEDILPESSVRAPVLDARFAGERRGFLPSGPDDTVAALDNVKGGPRRQEHSLNETAPRYGDSNRNLPRKTAALAVADWLVNASCVAVGGGGDAAATGPLPHVGDKGDACLDCVGVS